MPHTRRSARVLYHYTSAAGLLGILDNGAVWASDTRFMNDSEELRLAIHALARRVRERLRRVTNRTSRIAIEGALSMATQSGFSAYVASFTERGDLLSQWRAYAPRDGVSVGFLANALRAVKGFQLSRCEYIDEMAFVARPLSPRLARVARDVDACVARLARVRGLPGSSRAFEESAGDRRYRRKLELVHCILHRAIWLKHEGFAEEREWRLVRYEPPYLYPEPPATEFRPRFRPGSLGLTPYLSAKLPGKHGGQPLGLAEIILGPSPNGEASASAVRAMLESRFDTIVPAHWCRLPYRSW